ncbi:Fc.00g027330.m01.CDS01 [Cosmosporella sp. VM-42]
MEKRSLNDAVPQLSCEHCRGRKVKCDKLTPCTNCVSAGVVCVPVHRLRLPRGRHTRRCAAVDDDLKKRIRRLEALISNGGPDRITGGAGLPGVDSYHPRIVPAPPSLTSSDPGVSHGSEKRALLVQRPDHFWADLAEEIYGLRDVIESAPNEAEEDSIQTPEATPIGLTQHGIKFLGLSGSSNPLLIPRNPDISHSRVLASQLGQVYLQQVDPLIKILHRPSVAKLMLQGERYLKYPDEHASVEVLKSAVMYSAANSMTENQCRVLFRAPRSSLVVDCRKACEDALERCGLLTTGDITVLQAFVLYLVARRSEDRSRAVWTLLALAVRIAKALSINLDPDTVGRRESFFVQQMRRRLWLTICLMDVQASFGLTSQPLIGLDEAISSSQLPSHINDSDFDLTTMDPVPDKVGLTDTTFAVIKYKLQLFGRLTNFGAHDEKSRSVLDGDEHMNTNFPSTSNMSDMEVRQQYVRQFEREVLQLLHLCDPESSPYAWLTLNSARCFVAGAGACALRPLQRLREGSQQPPPRVRGDTQLLRLSIQVLEKAMLIHTDPRGEGYRWYATIPWHALATIIAECYICTDAHLLRSVWPTVEASYQLHATAIARMRRGKLRGPLGKLMERTREKLAPILQGEPAATGSPSSEGPGNSTKVSLRPSSGLDTEPSEGIVNSLRAVNISPTRSPQAPQQGSSSNSSYFENQPLVAASFSPAGPVSASDTLDQSWGIWEEFVSDISFDDFTSPDMLFTENFMNGS